MFDITGFRIRRTAYSKIVWSYFPCYYVNKAGNQTNSKKEKRSVHETKKFGITKFVINRVYFVLFRTHHLRKQISSCVTNFKHTSKLVDPYPGFNA